MRTRTGERRVDFAYPEIKLGIEVDGYVGHGGFAAIQRDLDRQNEFREIGWTLLHYSWKKVTEQAEDVVEQVLRMHRLLTAEADGAG